MHSEYARNLNEKDPKKKKKPDGETALMFLKIIQINQRVNRRVDLSIYK